MASREAPYLTADATRIWAVNSLFHLDEAHTLGDLIVAAARVVAFIKVDTPADGRKCIQDIKTWAFDFVSRWCGPGATLAELLWGAEALARFAEAGETPSVPTASSSPAVESGLECLLSPPVPSQSVASQQETATASDRPSGFSVGGVATPTVADGNDAGNGVVSSSTPSAS